MRLTIRFSVRSPALLLLAFLAGGLVVAAPKIDDAISLARACVQCLETLRPLFTGVNAQ